MDGAIVVYVIMHNYLHVLLHSSKEGFLFEQDYFEWQTIYGIRNNLSAVEIR